MSKYPTSSVKNLSLNDDGSHPAFEWLSENKNLLLWGFLGIVAALIIASQIINWRMGSAEKDYFLAEAAFNQFQDIAINPTESSVEASTTKADLEQLQTLMQRHPELKPKYEGPLAQTLLINGQAALAQPLIEDIFKRTNPDHLRFYREYTLASVLIGKGLYQEALEKTLQLNQSIEQISSNNLPILSVFNLIRLALLYQQTGLANEEWKTWEKLQSSHTDHEALIAVDQTFKLGQASLSQYIEERRSAINNSH